MCRRQEAAGFIRTQSPKFLKKKKKTVVALLQLLDDLDDMFFAAAIAVQPWFADHPGRTLARAVSVVVLLTLVPLSAFALLA